MINDDIGELALKIMDTVAYGGPTIVVTASDMENLSDHEIATLQRAVAKSLNSGKIEVSYDYAMDTLTIKPKLNLST